MTFALAPHIPSIPKPPPIRPSIPKTYIKPPTVIQQHTTVIQHNYGGYGGYNPYLPVYHPWYHPVFVWPTYGNYSAGSVGGLETGLVVFLILVILGALGVTAWNLVKR